MTITIPTGELTGILSDAIPFAFPADDLPHVNCVRIEWDGAMLHAEATDTMHMARSSWHPDDDTNGNDGQGTLVNPLGGADDRWVVKDYRLPTKEAGTPLTLDYDRGKLTIKRSRDTGHTAKTIVVEGHMVDFPPVGKLLRFVEELTPTSEVSYSGAAVARVGQVRQRGLMRMQFGARRTYVTIGERFVASLAPDRSGEPREPTFDLRTASGVLVTGEPAGG